jgi:hypothetical protein
MSVTTPQSPPIPLSGIYKVIKGLNRNTTWVATGLLAPMICAFLMLALQERHAEAGNLTKEERQAAGDLLLNANRVGIVRNRFVVSYYARAGSMFADYLT